MAGLDGIINKIHPGDAMDKNQYDLPPEEAASADRCRFLDEALSALDADREFLTRGGVFSDDFINSYLELKQQDVDRVRMTPHPLEFELYYPSNPLSMQTAIWRVFSFWQRKYRRTGTIVQKR